MPLIQPDLLVRDVLKAGLADLMSDPSPLRDVFLYRPDDEIAQVIDYFTANQTPVRLGFPGAASELPGVFVFLMASSEAMQPIGGSMPDEAGDPSPDYVSEFRGTFFQTGVRVACWSVNADLTVWLQNIALWILLGNREVLNGSGLAEQAMSVSDFEPLPQWFPDFAFRRDLVLQAKHPATVKAAFPTVKQITVKGRNSNQPHLPAGVVTLRSR